MKSFGITVVAVVLSTIMLVAYNMGSPQSQTTPSSPSVELKFSAFAECKMRTLAQLAEDPVFKGKDPWLSVEAANKVCAGLPGDTDRH